MLTAGNRACMVLPHDLQGTERAVQNLTSVQLQDCSHWAPEDKCVHLLPSQRWPCAAAVDCAVCKVPALVLSCPACWWPAGGVQLY